LFLRRPAELRELFDATSSKEWKIPRTSRDILVRHGDVLDGSLRGGSLRAVITTKLTKSIMKNKQRKVFDSAL
jgi:hypothetical protein